MTEFSDLVTCASASAALAVIESMARKELELLVYADVLRRKEAESDRGTFSAWARS